MIIFIVCVLCVFWNNDGNNLNNEFSFFLLGIFYKLGNFLGVYI